MIFIYSMIPFHFQFMLKILLDLNNITNFLISEGFQL